MADYNGVAIARKIAGGIRARLVQQLDGAGLGETLNDPDNLKSTHDIDRAAAEIAAQVLGDSPCNLHVEGFAPRLVDNPAYTVYLDPVDGSLNWERGVADPAVVLAIAPGAGVEYLDDLEFAYVEGLRSGDRYIAGADNGVYVRRGASTTGLWLRCHGPELAQATGYLRCGYGRARAQLARTLPLFLAARDVRAFDNAGTEFAEISRSAAHFCVEARGVSDGFNILAWPLIRSAGGALTDIEGRSLAKQPYNPAAGVDYILAGSESLAQEIANVIHACAHESAQCVDSVAAALEERHTHRGGGAREG